jgi:Flp pilus assembly pilin Flp
MTNTFAKLINDENGFLISAELILVATIAVLGMVVGLSEIAFGINNELEDVGAAFGSVNQSLNLTASRGQSRWGLVLFVVGSAVCL